jgi:hypothetical protein
MATRVSYVHRFWVYVLKYHEIYMSVAKEKVQLLSLADSMRIEAHSRR